MIDFVVIGGMRCGTTSLFKYLSAHPDIFMPSRKELFFFSRDDRWAKGTGWYLKEFFRGAKPWQVKGEASPEYMIHREVPARLKRKFPDVKIIAILRDPKTRFQSHFLYAQRKNIKFGNIIEPGLYGKHLEPYYDLFPHDQIKVVFLEELVQDPQGVMNGIFRFLGVPYFFSDVFNRKYNQRGVKRFPRIESFFYRHRGPINLIKRFVPERMWGAVSFWFETSANIKRAECPVDIVYPVNHYDIVKLEGLIGRDVPWEDR